MPDRTIQINSFKYGLDTRREALSSLPGTLQTAENCHINSGGEVEKRKAFVKQANLFADNTYGLQDTDSGLVTFGSDAAPNTTLPTGVTYQRLQSPYGNAVTMSSVLFSCAFLGKAFVLAKFLNISTVYAFYNGVLVGQITDGIVQDTGLLTPETVSQLATSFAAIINRMPGWLADANVNSTTPSDSLGYHEFAAPGSVLVMSPVGVHFTPTLINNNSASGLLGSRLIDQNYGGVAAVGASAAFKLNAGTSGTVTVTAPAKADGTGTFQLSGGAVSFNTSLAQTAQDIATAINNNTSITGYTATFSLATVTVFAPPSFGDFRFNLTVVTTGTITTITDSPGNKFRLTVTPSTVTPSNELQSISTNIVFATLVASYTGNGGTVSFSWAPCDSRGTIITQPVTPTPGIVCVDLTSTKPSAIVFALLNKVGDSASGYALCTAVDNGPPIVTLTQVVSVTFRRTKAVSGTR